MQRSSTRYVSSKKSRRLKRPFRNLRMHHGLHNSSVPRIKPGGTFAKNLALLLIPCVLLYTSPARAITPGKALAIPAVAALAAQIMAVNMAMEDASRNPMDKDRRERAQRAVALLPAAILGVAAVFKAGKQLHDAD